MNKKILVACEYTQNVTLQLRLEGLNAFSNDILPTEGYKEYHIQDKLENVIKHKWDMIIAFPPCTHLAVSGARWFKEKEKDGRQQKAIDFFMMIANANSPFIAIENPVSIMSTKWRKPDQIIQPYYFGDSFQKTTCLWLKNLPRLKYTNITNKGEFVIYNKKKKSKLPKWYNKKTIRNRTFDGIAEAMGKQWGTFFKTQFQY